VGTGYLDPNNRAFDRGNCGTDRRHILNLTLVAQTPRFANSSLRAVGSGWKFAGIYRATSANFLSVIASTDRQLSGASNQRLNQVRGNVLCANPTPNCWIDPAAFTTPALGTLGNMGKSNVQGPGFLQFDLAVSREFRLREGQNLEIRGEAFNATNSFRAASVVTTQSATFGKILAAQDPRILQVAMKFAF
jgi:hypothetical protein